MTKLRIIEMDWRLRKLFLSLKKETSPTDSVDEVSFH